MGGVFTDADIQHVLGDLDSSFDAAASATAGASVYCSSRDWAASAAEHLHAGRAPVLLRREDHWVALSHGEHKQVGPYLQPLEADWGFACPLLGPDPQIAIRLLSDFLKAAQQRWHVLLLSGLPLALASNVALALDGRYRVVLRDGIRCQIALLEGGVEGFLGRRSARFRANLRRDRRRAEKRGIGFESVPPDTAASELIRRVIDVELRSWKHREGQSVLESARHRRFYTAALDRAGKRGALRAMFATLDGQDIAYVFGGVLGTTYRGFQLGYDDAFRNLGLGNQVQLALIAELADQGVLRYDLGMAMGYKARWADERLSLHTLVVVKPR